MTAPASPVYNGRYELRSQIARGGTAQVYLAHDLLLDRPVALKVLIPELSSDHSFVERFRREAQAAANLSHPNIVPVFDWGESESTYFIVMEYVDGEPLSSIIRTQAPLDGAQAASVTSDIAKALSYAHRHGVVHRDVKPGNVLITSDGQVKVTDFGIARAIGGGDEQVTQTGLVMGTATYFSPEQAQGFEVDGRSDVYSLGVVLYEMTTGRPPFSGETPVSIAYQHVREEPPTPRSLNPKIPVALEAIILQAMAKLPAQRYATAEEFRADLDRYVRGQTVLAAPPRPASGPETQALSQTTAVPRTSGGASRRSATQDVDSPRNSTPAWVASGVILLVAILLIGYFGGRQLGYFGADKYIKVPDVTLQNVAVAQSKLAKLGLTSKIEHVSGSSGHAKGTVISQSPNPPSSLKSGGSVTLDVSGAAPKGSIPSVVGMSYNQAVATLQSSNYKTTAKFVKATKPGQNQNQVIRQNPKANTSAAFESKVTLYVVRGNSAVAIPSFGADGTYVSGEAATAAITKAGLNLGTTKDQFSATVPTGDVISSDPASGTKALPGSSVNLVISEGGVTVPTMLGDSLQQAETALNSVGLTFTQGANIQTDVAGQVGNVALTSPSAGAVVAPGTSVKLRLGVAPPGSTTTTTTTTTIPPTTPGTPGAPPG